MSFVCDICGKSNMQGNLVSHSKQRMHRLFKPNLHSAKAIVNGEVKKLLVCTKCLRRLKRPEKKIQKIEKVGQVVKVERVAQVEKAEKEVTPQKQKEVKVKQTTVAELMKESTKEKPKKASKSAK